MKYTLTDQEQTIVTLREEQKLSFRAIGERLELSASKTSYAYHRATRKLRVNRFHTLREEQNQNMVSFSLSVGEAVTLQRILGTTRNTLRRKVLKNGSPLWSVPPGPARKNHSTRTGLNPRPCKKDDLDC